MPQTPVRAHPFRLATLLTATGISCLALMPLLLFYTRAGSDIAATLTGLLFVLHSAIKKDWDWTRQNWVRLAALFCGLCLVSSLLSGVRQSWEQALCLPRLFLFIAALQSWLLPTPRTATMLERIYLIMTVWLVSQSWMQFATGHNLMGYPRWADGTLTGPFEKPRAAFPFVMMFFPGVMPSILRALRDSRLPRRLLGFAVLLGCVATMIIIGQRVCTLLLLGGLTLTALLVRRFRLPFCLIALATAVILAALPVLSPQAYAKLVLKFLNQMGHFAQSDYGLLFRSATAMVLAHPWLGLGMDGFRHACHQSMHSPAVPFLGLPSLSNDIGRGCNIHPRNYNLRVATAAGIPGLMVFCRLIGTWLRTGFRALDVSQHPRQAMLLVICCAVLWPVTSTSSVFSFPTTGWLCLSLGWLLASSPTRKPDTAADMS